MIKILGSVVISPKKTLFFIHAETVAKAYPEIAHHPEDRWHVVVFIRISDTVVAEYCPAYASAYIKDKALVGNGFVAQAKTKACLLAGEFAFLSTILGIALVAGLEVAVRIATKAIYVKAVSAMLGAEIVLARYIDRNGMVAVHQAPKVAAAEARRCP